MTTSRPCGFWDNISGYEMSLSLLPFQVLACHFQYGTASSGINKPHSFKPSGGSHSYYYPLHLTVPVHLAFNEWKVKVTVPLFLTKSRYEDVWMSGGMSPRILNFGNRLEPTEETMWLTLLPVIRDVTCMNLSLGTTRPDFLI